MPPPDLPALTGLRFVAAALVFFGHAFHVVHFTDAAWIAQAGGQARIYGMTLFFVLSGFVIYLNYG
jgi:peptidoglycan/LPS O-acetylase OafA/YrhL